MEHLSVALTWFIQQAAAAPEQAHPWGLSDKIALLAMVVGFLQFAALVWTVGVMISHGRRKLRAYVLPDNAGITEGNMLAPPQPAKANIPGTFMLIKNYGRTPAYSVLSWMEIAVITVVQEKYRPHCSSFVSTSVSFDARQRGQF